MPIIKSAIKKLRKDIKRYKVNRAKKDLVKNLIKKAEKSKTAENIKRAISTIDKAVKTHLIHKNKASRLKSKLARLATAKKPGKSAATLKKPSAKRKKSIKT